MLASGEHKSHYHSISWINRNSINELTRYVIKFQSALAAIKPKLPIASHPALYYLVRCNLSAIVASLSRRWTSRVPFALARYNFYGHWWWSLLKGKRRGTSRGWRSSLKIYVGDRLIVNCISAICNNTPIALWTLEPGAIFLKGSLHDAIERVTSCRCATKGIDVWNESQNRDRAKRNFTFRFKEKLLLRIR